jgi:hypothetical protein
MEQGGKGGQRPRHDRQHLAGQPAQHGKKAGEQHDGNQDDIKSRNRHGGFPNNAARTTREKA